MQFLLIIDKARFNHLSSLRGNQQICKIWNWFITGVIFCYMIRKSENGGATQTVWEICDSQFLMKGWLYLILFLEIRLDNCCYSTDGNENLKGCFSHCM